MTDDAEETKDTGPEDDAENAPSPVQESPQDSESPSESTESPAESTESPSKSTEPPSLLEGARARRKEVLAKAQKRQQEADAAEDAPDDAGEAPLEVPRADAGYGRHKRRRTKANRKNPDKPALREHPLVVFALRYGFLGLILAAPLALGGVHVWTTIALGATATCLGALAVAVHWDRAPRFGLVGLGLAIWVLVTVLQAIPLPFGLVEAIAPHTAQRYADAAATLGQDVGWIPLSLAPAETSLAVWTLMGALGIYLVGSLHMRRRETFDWIVPRLAAVGFVFLVICVVQTGLFGELVLGVYRPSTPLRGALVTTFVNPNHASAFFGAFAPISLGIALGARDPGRRNGFVALYLMMSLAMFLTFSRAAILSWALSHSVFLLVMRAERLRRPWTIVVVGALMLLAVSLATWYGQRAIGKTFDEMVSGFETVTENATTGDAQNMDDSVDANLITAAERPKHEKVAIYGDVANIIKKWPMTGIGRNAFHDVYPGFSTHGTPRTWRHVENEYLEMFAEYGIPLAALILGLIVLGVLLSVARPEWSPPERPIAAGLFTAIAFVALQNIFDFNLRFAGLAFLMAGCLGLLTGRATRYQRIQNRKEGKQRGSRIGTHILTGALILGLVVTVARFDLALAGTSRGIEDVRRTVASLQQEEELPDNAKASLSDVAAQALVHHPSSGYLHFLIAVGMIRVGDGKAAAVWLERARDLAPGDYRTHILLGRVHASNGDFDLAASEFSVAGTLHWGPSRAMAESAAETLPELDHLIGSLSTEPADWTALGRALIQNGRFAEATEVGEWLAENHADHPEGLHVQLEVLLALQFPEAAEPIANDLTAQFANLPVTWLDAARVANALGKAEQADALLSKGIEQHPKSIALLFARCDLLISETGMTLFRDDANKADKQAWEAAVDELLDQTRPVAIPHDGYRFKYHTYKGNSLRLREDHRGALSEFERALRLNDSTGAMVAVFEAAMAAGQYTRAEEVLKTLGRKATREQLAPLRERLDEAKLTIPTTLRERR